MDDLLTDWGRSWLFRQVAGPFAVLRQGSRREIGSVYSGWRYIDRGPDSRKGVDLLIHNSSVEWANSSAFGETTSRCSLLLQCKE
jgi:hypothetical protein